MKLVTNCKIVNYLSLIGWKEIYFRKCVNSIYYIDSLSLLFLAKIFNKKVEYLPGAKALNSMDLRSEEFYFLTPYFLPQYRSNKQYVLEDFNKEVFLSKNLNNWLNKINAESSLLLGIASPKQNKLATLIAKKYSFNIHCFGAALIEKDTSDFKYISKWSGKGLEWFFRLTLNPNRFFHKVLLIFFEIIRLIFSKENRRIFNAFLIEVQNAK